MVMVPAALCGLASEDGIITVVDAKHCLQHLHEEKPDGVENEAIEQLAYADRIIVNKTDLVRELSHAIGFGAEGWKWRDYPEVFASVR